jgi:uncharacterized protein (DUF433 family)
MRNALLNVWYNTDIMKDESKIVHDRITSNPKIAFGKPVVAGTRIPVEKVLIQLSGNPDHAELFEVYPELTEEDVKASLEYASSVVASQNPQPRHNPEKDKHKGHVHV